MDKGFMFHWSSIQWLRFPTTEWRCWWLGDFFTIDDSEDDEWEDDEWEDRECKDGECKDGECEDDLSVGDELRLKTGADIDTGGGEGDEGCVSSFSSGCLIMLVDGPDIKSDNQQSSR